MPLLTDEAEARARISAGCSADTDPALAAGDLDRLVAPPFKVASEWAAETVYAYGEVVIPVTRNGRRYKVVTAGTGAATEPSWPDYDGGRVTDGTATLEEIGPEVDLWDIGAAIHEGWKLKMGYAARRASIAIGQNRKEAQHIFDHCKEMMMLYLPTRVA